MTGWVMSSEIVPIRMSLVPTDDKSTLVQVMAWCHQATSHYLIQCWPRFLPPYGATRPQWVELFSTVEKKLQHENALFTVLQFYLIKAWWCICASVNWLTIGSDNGLLPVWYQSITWVNVDFLAVVACTNIFCVLWMKKKVCKMLPILWFFWSHQCVN